MLAAASGAAAPAGAAGPRAGRVAIATTATNDYYARGALVALHSARLHSQASTLSVDFVLLTAGAALSEGWRRRFTDLWVRVEDVSEVRPSLAVQAAMDTDRVRLQRDGLLEVLQPVEYGGAFLKVHAWDPLLFLGCDKVVLLDGDVLALRDISGLLALEPISAAGDLMDPFNYGVVVLRPDEVIHRDLLRLLTGASAEEVARYNSRRPNEAGFCDQTLVSNFLVRHHGPIRMFEDLEPASRADPRGWVLSTPYNLVVSYRAAERCQDPVQRKWFEEARLVHFANNWLHFGALALDRDAPGRIDSPRCYRRAFRYWHDVLRHALRSTARAAWTLGQRGQSCLEACGGLECVQDEWPASRDALEAVLAEMGHAGCKRFSAEPRKRGPGQTRSGECFWSTGSATSCQWSSKELRRFCPCSLPARPASPPPAYAQPAPGDEEEDSEADSEAVGRVFADFPRAIAEATSTRRGPRQAVAPRRRARASEL